MVSTYIQKQVDIRGDDNRAIRRASRTGHVEVVRLLLEHGADPTAYGNEAIRLASHTGHVEIVQLLLEHGADPTVDNNYVIQLASQNGYIEVVKLLLEHGADPTADNNYAIRWASLYGYIEVVKLLLEHGADPTMKGLHGSNAIEMAEKDNHNDIVKIIEEHIKTVICTIHQLFMKCNPDINLSHIEYSIISYMYDDISQISVE